MMKPLLRVIFPERCLACETRIESGDPLCVRCHAVFPWLPEAHCERCAAPFAAPQGGCHLCATCLQGSYALGKVWALGVYRGVLHDLIIRLKYRHQEWLASPLADQMFHGWSGEGYDLVLPVPLHRRRLRQRGFNQAAWLARDLARHAHLQYDPLRLRKHRETVSQTELGREARIKNNATSFSVTGDVAGLTILLVDDVYTTGATLESCARVLQKAGAKEVDAYVVARAA